MQEIIIFLLVLDILLGFLYRILDVMKPKPMTFLEFFNFVYDENLEVKELLKKHTEQTLKAIFETYLKTKDDINKSKNER